MAGLTFRWSIKVLSFAMNIYFIYISNEMKNWKWLNFCCSSWFYFFLLILSTQRRSLFLNKRQRTAWNCPMGQIPVSTSIPINYSVPNAVSHRHFRRRAQMVTVEVFTIFLFTCWPSEETYWQFLKQLQVKTSWVEACSMGLQ